MKIILKQWEEQDKTRLMELCNQVDRTYLSGGLPYPYTLDDANWWLNHVKEHEGKDAIFRAIVVDNEIVGMISIEQKSDVFKKDGKIGYCLQNESWSKGIMSEAVKQICKIAFVALDIVRISGEVFSMNLASRKVLEKNQFQLEGILKKALIKEDQLYDLCIYALLK